MFLLFLVLFVHRYRLIQTCNFAFSSGSVKSFFDPSMLYYLLIPIFVKKCIDLLAMSSLFVISVLFMLISVGKLFLLPFLEMISFIVFHRIYI